MKSRKALSIRRLKSVLVAEIPVKAKPLPVVRTLLNGNALALQQRVVPTAQLRGDGKHVMLSRNCITCRFGMIGRQISVAKSAVLVRQRFVSMSINILIYKGIVKNMMDLLLENNFVKATSYG
jgi:hypothetical protein